MPIPYNAAIPQATDKLVTSQADILANFAGINTWTGVNHLNFADANAGKHSKMDIVANATHPLTAANELLLYNFVNPTTTVNELYVKKAGALAVAGIPMTARGGTTAGWTYLPSGILMKWGTIISAAASNVTLNAVAGPSFNAAVMPFAAFVTAQQTTFGAAAGFLSGVAANPILQVRTFTVGCPCYWLVIGI